LEPFRSIAVTWGRRRGIGGCGRKADNEGMGNEFKSENQKIRKSEMRMRYYENEGLEE
jgi:hypothetical protein